MKKKTTSPNVIKFQQAITYNSLKRKKKKKRSCTALNSVPVDQPSNAPHVPKTRSMTVKAAVLSPMVAEVYQL